MIPGQEFSYDIFAFTLFAPPLMFGSEEGGRKNRVLVEVIDCQGFMATPSILGTPNYHDILTSKITDLEDQYFENGVFVGLSPMQTPGYYYYGVKYQ